ncbi:hypothetical protein DNTS_021725, partial [Danionella cerebrum]
MSKCCVFALEVEVLKCKALTILGKDLKENPGHSGGLPPGSLQRSLDTPVKKRDTLDSSGQAFTMKLSDCLHHFCFIHCGVTPHSCSVASCRVASHRSAAAGRVSEREQVTRSIRRAALPPAPDTYTHRSTGDNITQNTTTEETTWGGQLEPAGFQDGDAEEIPK